MKTQYDVIICGGGLAGQTLARQLKLRFQDLRILMISKEVFPLPAAATKVGESTVEIAAFYFAETLRLRDYFKNNQYAKLGLRYFFGNGRQPLAQRPELGLSAFGSYDSFQIDRGVFENDLYEFNRLAGVTILEGAAVKEIDLDESNGHRVHYQYPDTKATGEATARWVVDATGRRSFLQRKLGLRVEVAENFSAAWFRVPGRLDLDDFVDRQHLQWHLRVPNRIRFYSTNHLMGHGYWVWLIPLPSGNTSVGIVTSEKIHPCATYNNVSKAMNWLARYEPVVHKHLNPDNFLDFKVMKNYAYTSRQVFSAGRWACTGEAGVFPDPFYSPGSNLIGFANTIITHMIGLDKQGQLSARAVEGYNDFVLSYQEWLLRTIHPAYSYFGEAQIMSLNFLWDTAGGWAVTLPQMFNHIYLSEPRQAAIRKATARFTPVALRVKQLFREWEPLVQGRFTFQFIDYLAVPFIAELYDRNLKSNKPLDELVADQEKNVPVLEEFARAIFLLAVEDTMPEKLPLFPDPFRINAQAISLRSGDWNAEGLFADGPAPDHGYDIYGQLRRLYTSGAALRPEQAPAARFNFEFN